MKRILPGQKVKIYTQSRKTAEYGEVLGIGYENRLVVARRSEFESLNTSDFDHFRDARDVVFVNGPQLPIIKWQPNSSTL